MINRPTYVDKIIKYVNTPFVKILTGVRRCGKTTILKLIMQKLETEMGVPKENIISVRYDSMEYEGISAKEMYTELKSKLSVNGKTYLFLDEVQEVDGWEKAVNSLQSDFDVDIYVTGSNSRMMSSEISTYLTGRYVSFHIYTLSFAEYIDFKSRFCEIDNIKSELVNYIKCGGFPATVLQHYEQDEIYTIVKDHLERIVKFAFDNVGNTFSAKSISDYLKSQKRTVDNETVYSYLDKLVKAYILHKCSRYDIKGKEILKTQEKFYVADTSFKYSVLGYDPNTVAASLENVVYLELCRRGYTVNIGKIDSAEIDFVAVKQNDKIYVQVTQEIKSDSTHKREYDRLLDIPDNYPKYVLRTDEFADGNYNGIKTMHIADFLLSDEF